LIPNLFRCIGVKNIIIWQSLLSDSREIMMDLGDPLCMRHMHCTAATAAAAAAATTTTTTTTTATTTTTTTTTTNVIL